MANLKPFSVTPSQLAGFKQVANELSNKISELKGQNKLSSFMRNDCLARGLGLRLPASKTVPEGIGCFIFIT